MKNKPVIYFDACCFIDAVKQEVGALPTERDADVWHLKKLLQAHYEGDVRVMTSTLSLAECVAIESGQDHVPENVQDVFRRLLMSGQYVVLAPQTPRTGRLVQELRWQHGVVLRGADALHVATALEVQAREFITTDAQLRNAKFSRAIGQLQDLGVRFIRGAESEYVPERFRQGSMLDD